MRGGGKLSSQIDPVGQTGTHLRHSLHLSSSIYARLFSMVMASNGHAFTHFPQAIHATSHDLFAVAPLSWFIQLTNMRRDLGPCLRNSIRFFGQATTHLLHAVHFSSSTSGISVIGFTCIASNGHTASQSPKP